MIHRHHNPQWINPKAERTREAMSEEGFQQIGKSAFSARTDFVTARSG
jgi:hypothetical protein